jgi:superfamily II DNA/RNA helicase
VAENFIHRVGRTGRAGKQGIASTLFVKEQRSELFQLERTLGIRIEKMRADGIPAAESRDRNRAHVGRIESAPRARMVQLPGEVLQSQMQSQN